MRQGNTPPPAPWIASGQTPPIRIISPGRTYRCDSDATHTPMFHQLEGLVIDRDIHMGHLKWTLDQFIARFFELPSVVTRFAAAPLPLHRTVGGDGRASATPPAGEVKIGVGHEWSEIVGCGMVHPNVLRNCGIDPDEWQGFAFGFGVDRLARLKYGMPDLRDMFASDTRWLAHYGFSAFAAPNAASGLRVELMKFTLAWLREHLETTAAVDEIVEAMTRVGMEVEHVLDPAAKLAAFSVARIASRRSSTPTPIACACVRSRP